MKALEVATVILVATIGATVLRLFIEWALRAIFHTNEED